MYTSMLFRRASYSYNVRYCSLHDHVLFFLVCILVVVFVCFKNVLVWLIIVI